MATASELITDAYRDGNLIALGKTPNDAEFSEGLRALNGFLDSLLGFELGEYLMEWAVAPRNDAPVQSRFPLPPTTVKLDSNTYPYPPPNVRVLINVTTDTTIWFPPHPHDGARLSLVNLASDEVTVTLQGNGHVIEGVFTTSGLPSELNGRQYFYRADLGGWELFGPLALTDTPVLPSVYDELLTLGVLQRLASRNGRELTGDQVANKNRLIQRLKTQYRQPTPALIDADRVLTVPLSDYRSKGYYYLGQFQ